MDSNVGVASVSGFGSATIGSSFSSGWGGSYSFNNNPINYNTASFSSAKIESFDCGFIEKNVIDQPETLNSDEFSEVISGKTSGLLEKGFQKGLQKFLETFVKDFANLDFFKEKGLLAASFKKTGGKWVLGAVFNIAFEGIWAAAHGEEFDIKHQLAKTGADLGVTGLSVIAGCFIAKNWKDLGKGFDDLLKGSMKSDFGSKVASIWEDYLKDSGGNGLLSKLNIDPSGKIKPNEWIKIFREKGAFGELVDLRKNVFNSALKELYGQGIAKGVGNFVSSTGVAIGLDYGIGVVTNIGTGLLEGKGWDAFSVDNAHYGSELLKSTNKIIFSTAFRFIFGSFGLPDVGEKVGSLIASVINVWICEPFKDKDGNIDEKWCAIAAGAEFAGAVVGLIVALAICGSSGPVGWVVGLCIIGFAVLFYGLTVLAHFIAEHWDEFTAWVKETWNNFVNGAKIVAAKLCGAVVAAANFVKETWNNFVNGAKYVAAEFNKAVVAAANWGSDRVNDVAEFVGDVNDTYDNLGTGVKIGLAVVCPFSLLFWIR